MKFGLRNSENKVLDGKVIFAKKAIFRVVFFFLMSFNLYENEKKTRRRKVVCFVYVCSSVLLNI